ncbi:adenylyl-sulfate kinase [Lactiplantibacillus mudanjiangensis]|uniref:Adenylyl-sulfate kinase n=1 Tax=Lactiplantibacillus mudanjiangensis TaxID=1296538 RepID=A0A660DWN7_9LACO|nr:adenylyl-sulfate kinase [Lactiplantibacillus mudanjiangensis]VDG18979.1 adenylyl-sulfate kinase [Lactobacillus sp.] [Lactiplantibacillus mudanjiangensis]VDG25246.1 adenylyl-sulfate kinase [Lactobacillus sp.] [Lactiplantibacillus mudanjiangensis]VDG27500.1 adenylyl-sulfate kinase [Lactobacillus sp.] [Lactiplantibacillus mudanjiangensis]VDG33077.1 adenylyl-sulfate kinase [Lactobacillus sp.] [Lactiplantibacillus mudanjiangensis]
MSKSTNITWQNTQVSKQQRQTLAGHRSPVLWFTGLSGSGKSTIANAVAQRLYEEQVNSYVLDGDNMRFGLNSNLGFSAADRQENIRRVGEVSKLFVDAGVITLTAFISPYQADRDQVRDLLAAGEFVEIFVDTPLAVCEERDVKQLYAKARRGDIKGFTGIDAPYEAPTQPEITIDTSKQPLSESVEQIMRYLTNHGYLDLSA